MTKEQEILNYMKKLDISREEAEQLWEDDHEGYESPEMVEMEKKAKQLKRYEKSGVAKKRTPKERKVDEEKKHLLDCYRVLTEGLEGTAITAIKNEAEFSFTLNGNSYTVKLIKHRAPK